MMCRHCHKELQDVFLDLGFASPSNAYLSKSELNKPEVTFPLKLFVCKNCWLVQTEDYNSADDLFSKDYAYFSSTSKTWVEHARLYSEYIVERLNLGRDSFVLEIASNDGYLLKNFVERGIPCLGVEPTDSTADAAEEVGVPVLREFFGTDSSGEIVKKNGHADLICGNNVYAHVPDINDFTNGLKVALKEGGTINLEFPHLLRLIEKNQFDTVYHEHFSYLSLSTVSRIFDAVGLRVFDVEELPTHGGSLRVYGCHYNDSRECRASVSNLLALEADFGLLRLDTYRNFQAKANRVKNDILEFLIRQKKQGDTIVAYGAAAKGNTLLNYAGVKTDLIDFVCDASPSKQGKFMPGSHLPIMAPEVIERHKPDWIVILPWNIADEIVEQLNFVREWGARFIVAVPELRVI